MWEGRYIKSGMGFEITEGFLLDIWGQDSGGKAHRREGGGGGRFGSVENKSGGGKKSTVKGTRGAATGETSC